MVAAGPATDGTGTRPESIPLSAPEIAGNEWQYVRECLDTGWVSSAGAFVDRFEATLAAHTGRRHAVATMNGTSALHAALVAAGIGDHDEVIVSTLTFIAPANAIRYTGAAPVFVDADPRYWQMDPDKLRHLLERQCAWRAGALYNRSTGRRVRAIVPVDALGHPADLDAIVEIARRYELIVIEDASESLGAEYRDAPVGRHGDIVCFSFNGNKIVTAGGGGALLTDHAEWARRARHLTTQAKADPVEYVHDRVGYNYRLTNLQAAVGVAQLERLGHAVAAKRRIAAAYAQGFAGVDGLTPMPEASWARSTFWLYTVLVDRRRFGVDARGLMRHLRQARIESRPLWQPLHRSPAHAGSTATDCRVAERLHETALSLPSSVGLTPAAQAAVIDAVMACATRPVRTIA